ncbi:MAG: hypothetical protein JJ869_18975 [Marivita sp.]|uniref:hypothetical protein n=1 Tax=Marivita sp. TaxID=2003365 RepID=UPI001B07E897|nr:hypothetical protein [Marivita sp.]MBO6885639.1 hypothetical protein [Marivita sp.]
MTDSTGGIFIFALRADVPVKTMMKTRFKAELHAIENVDFLILAEKASHLNAMPVVSN